MKIDKKKCFDPNLTVVLHGGLNSEGIKKYDPNGPTVVLHPGLNENPTKLHTSFSIQRNE